MKVTVLIVDDEPHARRYLRDLLIRDREVDLLGECKNGREALTFIHNKKPDIVLLDIQMPGITGIEVAHQVKSSGSLVIFTTAYDQYALKAFEAEALNYLLKPFDEKRFFEVLHNAKDMIALKQQAALSEKIMGLYNDYRQARSPHLTEFVIRDKGLERVIKTNDIVFLEARSVYVILHTLKDAVLYRAALNLLAQQLPPEFLQIHRSYVINTAHIRSFRYLNNNTFVFDMANGKKVRSSRSYKNDINKKMSG